MSDNKYVIRVLTSPLAIAAADWDDFLHSQSHISPFMRHAYLAAMHSSGSAQPKTGWTPRFITLWLDDVLQAVCPLYLKSHSYGEYVFDWAWADAYQRHGLPYYPKAVIAPPFTPVPGTRLLARDAPGRVALVRAVIAWCEAEQLSSLHLLFGSADDIDACAAAGMMLRHSVQFHWQNATPTGVADVALLLPAEARVASPHFGGENGIAASSRPFRDFDDFLASLVQEKRKKIRQERRKVAEAGVSFRWMSGKDISTADWDFFYRCYERTYLEHGNAPYLSRGFFQSMADAMPENWLLFIAERNRGDSVQPVAASLIGLGTSSNPTAATADGGVESVAYGRYWGALERVDCLHFEACYYQPLQWCIDHGYARFEGGAQGEHKMARALMPVRTSSAHWLAHPAFADAVERFLEREGEGISDYLDSLAQRTPLRQHSGPVPGATEPQ